MIRTILIILSFIIFFITGIVTLPLFRLIGKFDKHKGDLLVLRAGQFLFNICLFIAGTKAEYVGLENIPSDTPVMYIGNHRSFFDIFLIYLKCPDLTGFVAKKELKKVPVLPIWMKRLYCVFLDRSDARAGMKSILQAIEFVKNGISIFIFPEGTRNKDAKKEQELLPFKEGPFKIAKKSGCPVLPVAVTGTADIFENHLPFVKPRRVVVSFGKPVYIDSLTKEEQMHCGQYFMGIMTNMLDENELLLSEKSGT